MTKYVGIDLGTTFSAIAALNAIGRPEIVPNADGERITPSLVWFPENESGRSFVGIEAKNQRNQDPSRVASEVKRKMGEVAVAIDVDGLEFSPEAISSMILRKLVEDAKLEIGTISEVVITVPAYFEEAHRKATMDAGELAGLSVQAIGKRSINRILP